MGFANDILGGAAALIRAAIKSPNFVHGSTGWSVNKDGSAEFNSGTFRANIVGGAVYIYDPAITLGDLIASITDATTGPEGETTIKGITSYVTFAGDKLTVSLNGLLNGNPGLSVTDQTNPATSPAGVGAHVGGAGALSPGGLAFLTSGQGPVTDVAGSVVVQSQTTSGVTNGTVALNGGSTTVTGKLTATSGTPSNLSVISTDTWHAMTLANGWANTAGNVTAQYRLLASPPNSVEIIGAILATGATSTTFFTLPAGYQPATQQAIPAGATGGQVAGTTPFVQCSTAGVLTLQHGTIGAVDTYVFHGTISLDA